jgi:hypothetical protein
MFVAGCNQSRTPSSLFLSPGSLALNAGSQATLNISSGGPAVCSATGGVLTQSGSTLTYTAPNASGFFEIRCDRNGQSAIANVAVTGPLPLEYVHHLPDHQTAPSQVPIFWILDATFTASAGCHDATWLGGNHWTCTFPLAAPTMTRVRVHDGPRNEIEPALNAFFCATVRYNGAIAQVLPDNETGCVATFR